MTLDISKAQQAFVKDIAQLVANSKQQLAVTVNSHITHLYWQIGHKINHHILGNKRADYGKKIVQEVARYLSEVHGKGFEHRNIRRMMKFAHIFDDEQKVSTLSTKLSWSHFVDLISIEDDLEREFYAQMCRMEGWSVRMLRSNTISIK